MDLYEELNDEQNLYKWVPKEWLSEFVDWLIEDVKKDIAEFRKWLSGAA